MNAPSPTTPSPLVPQGSIPPRNGSRSGRVLLIALTVVAFHLAGLGVVLMQGCKNDTKTSGLGTGETNSASALSYPENTNSSIFSPATNVAATPARTNPAAMTGTTPGMGAMPAAPTNVGLSAPIPNPGPAPGLAEPPPAATAAETGATTDYKVVAGDNLGKIAAKNHITLNALNKANPGIDPKKLKVGQTIKVPVASASAAAPATTATLATRATGSSATTTTAAPIAGASGTYKVKAGDTLTKIAKANGVTVPQLRAANNLKTSQLLVGKVLKIPARSTAAAPDAATNH